MQIMTIGRSGLESENREPSPPASSAAPLAGPSASNVRLSNKEWSMEIGTGASARKGGRALGRKGESNYQPDSAGPSGETGSGGLGGHHKPLRRKRQGHVSRG